MLKLTILLCSKRKEKMESRKKDIFREKVVVFADFSSIFESIDKNTFEKKFKKVFL